MIHLVLEMLQKRQFEKIQTILVLGYRMDTEGYRWILKISKFCENKIEAMIKPLVSV
jgi:hypothetical protein